MRLQWGFPLPLPIALELNAINSLLMSSQVVVFYILIFFFYFYLLWVKLHKQHWHVYGAQGSGILQTFYTSLSNTVTYSLFLALSESAPPFVLPTSTSQTHLHSWASSGTSPPGSCSETRTARFQGAKIRRKKNEINSTKTQRPSTREWRISFILIPTNLIMFLLLTLYKIVCCTVSFSYIIFMVKVFGLAADMIYLL